MMIPTTTEVIPSLAEDDSLLPVVDVGRCVLVAGYEAGVVEAGGVEGGEEGGNRTLIQTFFAWGIARLIQIRIPSILPSPIQERTVVIPA